MDDAGNGSRGLRPTLTPAVADAVLRTWGINCANGVDLGGSTSLNLLVNAGHRSLVVRVHRRHVTAARVEALQLAREAAVLGGVPVARPVLGRNGERRETADSLAIEVEDFVAGDEKMDTLAKIGRGMPVLASLHAALEHAPLPDAAKDMRFGNYLAVDDLVSRTAAGIERIRSLDRSLKPVADLASAVADKMTHTTSRLPKPQWCHGDFWDDNVLFRQGRVVLVADFGFMNRRPRVDDLALTLYYTLCDLDGAGLSRPFSLARGARQRL
jgi:homoserine kinase type II